MKGNATFEIDGGERTRVQVGVEEKNPQTDPAPAVIR